MQDYLNVFRYGCPPHGGLGLGRVLMVMLDLDSIYADRLTLRTPADMVGLDLDLLLGATATGLDPAHRTVALADGSAVSYDGLVIATGVRPRRLPGEGAHVLRTLDATPSPCAMCSSWAGGWSWSVPGSWAQRSPRSRGSAVPLLEPAPVPLAHAGGDELAGC